MSGLVSPRQQQIPNSKIAYDLNDLIFDEESIAVENLVSPIISLRISTISNTVEPKVQTAEIKSIRFNKANLKFMDQDRMKQSKNTVKSRNYYSPEQRLMHGQIKDISDFPSPVICNRLEAEINALT